MPADIGERESICVPDDGSRISPGSPSPAETSFSGARGISFAASTPLRTICEFTGGENDRPYRTFTALAADVEAKGKSLRFAMNGGMYQRNFQPVGLYIENGRALIPANTATGTGTPNQIPNFYKKPNEVFYIGDERFLAYRPKVNFATQSGPMLIIDRAIHPAFIENSTDRKRRNGVGVSNPNEVHFVISRGRVNFHEFARFFRDSLGCNSALFLDGGAAPGIYVPELGRNDTPGHGGYGPIIGEVE